MLFGISGTSDLNDSWEFTGSSDIIRDLGGVFDFNISSVGASYAATDRAEVYSNVGVAHISSPVVSGSENEVYVSFGVRMDFGTERGTTFGRRGPLAKLPGLPG